MSNLGIIQPITFTIQGPDASSFVGIWVQYEGDDEEVLAYDGTSFITPFVQNSTVEKTLGDDTLQNFSVVPEGGWPANLASIRVQGFPVIS